MLDRQLEVAYEKSISSPGTWRGEGERRGDGERRCGVGECDCRTAAAIGEGDRTA